MTPTPDEKHPHIQHYADGTASVMRKVVVYTELRFYKRSDVLYQLTQVFCQRYLPRYGDRTVDQMVQAARSTKQNIAEGSTDGQTSTETELKLLGPPGEGAPEPAKSEDPEAVAILLPPTSG